MVESRDVRIPVVKVLLTTQDGELLDQFLVIGDSPTLRPAEITLSKDVRQHMEMVFETEDIR